LPQNSLLTLVRYLKHILSLLVNLQPQTPKGNFKIINKAHNSGGPFGARWLGLSAPYGDYGIHGTNNPSSIGKAVSNGCIRTYNNNIIELYNLVPVGTPVKIV
jgi:lipoprotein-anchoring transpeptidase ErfK/SrfK